jgi:hypothetical protein
MTGDRLQPTHLRHEWPERFEVPRLPEWFHEPGETLGYIPWQHTPLDPFDTLGIGIQEHQAELRTALNGLIDTPLPYLEHRGFEKLVRLDFLSGMTMREAQCSANFHAWADGHPEELQVVLDTPRLKAMLDQGIKGYGTALSQLELLCAAPSLESLDLLVLTTPYGYRRQHLPAMHDELRQALESLAATIYTEPQWLPDHPPKIAVDPTLRVHSSADPRGLLVTFKRKVAELPDPVHADSMIEVLERESWLVPTSAESGFSQDIIFSMWREPTWQRTKPRLAAQVQRYVMGRIERQQGVVPLAVATYARRTEADVA